MKYWSSLNMEVICNLLTDLWPFFDLGFRLLQKLYWPFCGVSFTFLLTLTLAFFCGVSFTFLLYWLFYEINFTFIQNFNILNHSHFRPLLPSACKKAWQ